MSDDWNNALDDADVLPTVELAAIAEEANGAIAQGTAMLQTRGAYSTAMKVAVPRDLKLVQARLVQEAELLGEDAYYGWGAGKDQIEGPSQALAHSAARCWGNCAVEPGPVQDLPGEWIVTMYFIDHETGFTLGRPFKQSKKSIVYGKHDAERKADIRFAIGVSKSTRNVLLKALPKSIIDRAIRAAKRGVREKLEKFVASKGVHAAFDICLRELAKKGVDEAMVLKRLDIADAGAIDVERLILLRGDISALQQGEVRAVDLYKGAAKSNDPPKGQIDPSAIPEAEPEDKGPQASDKGADSQAPWPTITKKQVADLRKRLKALDLTDADLIGAVGVDDVGRLEEFPKDRHEEASGILEAQEKKAEKG